MRKRRKIKSLGIGGIIVLALPVILVLFLSSKPFYEFRGSEGSGLIVAFKAITDKSHICTKEEVEAFLEVQSHNERKHLRRRANACGSRDRVPLGLLVRLDGKVLMDRVYFPSGLRRDGNTFVFKKFFVSAGEHKLEVAIRDTKKGLTEYDHTLSKTVDFKKLKFVVLDFDPVTKEFRL